MEKTVDYELDKEEKAQKTKNKKRGFAKVCSIVLDILIIPVIIIAFVCVMLTFSAKANNKVPSIFGMSIVTVQSGSMEPDYMVGDVLVIKKANLNELKAGDNIAFYAPLCSEYTVKIDGKKQSLVIFHKIVRIIDIEGVRHFVCMGTNVAFDYTDDNNFVLANNSGTGNYSKDTSTGKYFMQQGGDYFIKLQNLKTDASEDNLTTDDTQTNQTLMQYVTDDLVVGVYDQAMSPAIGGFINFSASSTGILCLVILPSVLLIGLTIISLTKEVKQVKEEDEKEKLVLEGNISKLKETSTKAKQETKTTIVQNNKEGEKKVNIENVIEKVSGTNVGSVKQTKNIAESKSVEKTIKPESQEKQSQNKTPKTGTTDTNQKTVKSSSTKMQTSTPVKTAPNTTKTKAINEQNKVVPPKAVAKPAPVKKDQPK